MTRRWNGWGDVERHYPLPGSAITYLEKRIGKGTIRPDASLDDVISIIPSSRLPSHPKILTNAEERLAHARGQSLPDWISLRYGKIETFPDGVAYPASEEDIQNLVDFAMQSGVCLIPYGGGTSVVGHINPPLCDKPILTIDLCQMNRLIKLSEKDHLATFEAGVCGPLLERQLRNRGYTLGHFPQSFEYSTLGGWIATRSSGQQSYFYGRIEDLFAGGHVITPSGLLDLPPYPASAAGPDLRHLILGSEGRFGILTKATVRVRRIPEVEGFYGVIFPNWEFGISTVRVIAQEKIAVSMLRLSDPMETEITLNLSGHEKLLEWAKRCARLFRWGRELCLLIIGITGTRKSFEQTYNLAMNIAKEHKGILLGSIVGEQWRKTRFATPYLRNTLWENGYAIDTLETAINWSSVPECALAILKSIDEMEKNILAFSHLSHVYRDGASIYVTYIIPREESPEEMLNRWKAIKSAASQTILSYGGTISHQHGIGQDHLAYLVQEKSKIGMEALKRIGEAFDPQGILNPGTLFPK